VWKSIFNQLATNIGKLVNEHEIGVVLKNPITNKASNYQSQLNRIFLIQVHFKSAARPNCKVQSEDDSCRFSSQICFSKD
jgi:hypothetical protein